MASPPETQSVPAVAPAFYTPDDHLFADTTSTAEQNGFADLNDEEFGAVYEIDDTVKRILDGGYCRVALQFPDELLGDSTRVYGMVHEGINAGAGGDIKEVEKDGSESTAEVQVSPNGCCGATTNTTATTTTTTDAGCCSTSAASNTPASCCKTPAAAPTTEKKVFILADTSYSSCCIDEVAAAHCAADFLIHYGRSCLSPTTHLPVHYVFTSRQLPLPAAISSFTATFPDKASPVILMADVTYAAHIAPLHAALVERGYTDTFPTEVVHDPTAPLPNRTYPSGQTPLSEYSLWHIAPPLPSLALLLSSRVSALYTYAPSSTSPTTPESTAPLLRRRYALLSRARSAAVIGILINTLNVRHYLAVIEHTKALIKSAGRKPYLVVVGKVNVAKVANFEEVDVWVGIGCWEQGIVGSAEGREWYKPVVTPWELRVALDRGGTWGGRWVVDFEELLKQEKEAEGEEEDDEEEDDEAPEFDLRTGRYVSTTRAPRKKAGAQPTQTKEGASDALIANPASGKQVLAGGVISPAAEFLRDKRSWRGLGSDFAVGYEEEVKGAIVEVGRSGVARGYTVGDGERH